MCNFCYCNLQVGNLSGPEGKIINYDADHERRRKQQLLKLWDRTPKQVTVTLQSNVIGFCSVFI